MLNFIKKSVASNLAKNTAWMFFGQGMKLAIRALYFVEIARSLGASNYGAFIGVVALVGVASPFGDLGSGGLLVKNVSRHKHLFPIYWAKALIATSCASAALIAIVMLVSGFALPASIPELLVFLVATSDLLGVNLITICADSFLAFDRLNWTSSINVLMSASRLAGATALIAIHPHPSPLQWGYIYCYSTMAVAITAVALSCSKLGYPRRGEFRWAAEFREGIYFAVSQSAQTIYDDIDKTMLARLDSLAATGIFGAAYRLIGIAFVPVFSLLQASYSSFFRAGSRGISSCMKYARPLLAWSLLYGVVIAVVLLLSAGIVPDILGAQFAESANALRWLAILPLLKVLSYFFSNTLTGAGYQGARAGVQVAVAIFNVLINLWIIPLYSWRGAALSSIASDALLALGTGAVVVVIARHEKTRATGTTEDALI